MGFCLPTENGKEATSLEIRKDREKSAYIKSRRKEITPSIAGRDFRLSFHLTLPLKPDLVSLSSSCLQRGHNASKTNCVSKMVLSAAEKRRKEVKKEVLLSPPISGLLANRKVVPLSFFTRFQKTERNTVLKVSI